jgi:hypothetical protein
LLGDDKGGTGCHAAADQGLVCWSVFQQDSLLYTCICIGTHMYVQLRFAQSYTWYGPSGT